MLQVRHRGFLSLAAGYLIFSVSEGDEVVSGDGSKKKLTRREMLKECAWYGGLVVAGSALGVLAGKAEERTVWQLDPNKCTQCGKCETECVLTPSAVKVVHAYAMCGYCELCTGFFVPDPNDLNTGAENQQCPTGAITRTFIEDPYYEYKIKEDLCIGCGICVRGCGSFGNGSLFLQVRHDRCLNCNQCSIASACPALAFKRVPASDPYLLKTREEGEG